MTITVVVADANILFSRTLRDYFLYLADEGALEIRWSRQILDEMSRNLRDKIGLSQADTSRLEELMNDYIEYALIEVDPEDLSAVEGVEMDAKDRHVLAATISADADILLPTSRLCGAHRNQESKFSRLSNGSLAGMRSQLSATSSNTGTSVANVVRRRNRRPTRPRPEVAEPTVGGPSR